MSDDDRRRVAAGFPGQEVHMKARLLLSGVVCVALCTAGARDGSPTPKKEGSIEIGFTLLAPDIWISSVHLSKNTFAPGERFAFTITVENRGTAVAPGSTQNGYKVDVSLGKQIASAPAHVHILPTPYRFVDDMLLMGGRLSNTTDLQPGDSRQYPVLVDLPQMKHGKYYLTVTADPTNRVNEPQSPPHGESDNQTTVAIGIVTPAQPTPDGRSRSTR
jgi:hypothetical protein